MPPPRPELENPPEVFYNATEARRYTVNTRIRKIQRDMTLRALELLHLPSQDGPHKEAALLLDIGCGSGISGDVLTEAGHAWFGVDISSDMLRIAKEDELRYYGVGGAGNDDEGEDEDEEDRFSGKRTRVDTSGVKWGLITEEDEAADEVSREDGEGDAEDEGQAGSGGSPRMAEVSHNDIGQGVPFRPGTFDGCVSISVIQWLCHSTKRGEVPQRRLMALFQSLYNALRRGAKAVLQFYPSEPEQVHMITRAAMKCGFNGGVVVDYPNSAKAKKYYLVLQAGQVAGGFVPPPGLTGDVEEEDDEMAGSDEEEEYYGSSGEDEDSEEGRSRVRVGGRDRAMHKRSRAHSSHQRRRKDNRPATGSREWVLLKKEERRRRGLDVTSNSKYTMRQRRPRF